MQDHVYKMIELAGSSESSIEDAIQNAVARAAKTLHDLRWFEVVETRGQIENTQQSPLAGLSSAPHPASSTPTRSDSPGTPNRTTRGGVKQQIAGIAAPIPPTFSSLLPDNRTPLVIDSRDDVANPGRRPKAAASPASKLQATERGRACRVKKGPAEAGQSGRQRPGDRPDG
jgi:flavin-binding protein dodecin